MAEIDDTGEPDSSPAGVPDKPAGRTPDKRRAELEIGWGERPPEPDRLSEDEERLLRERPPHWE
ncbi:hypothetical protein BH24ACT9_BH24ACT9_16300 [soil metagenome]